MQPPQSFKARASFSKMICGCAEDNEFLDRKIEIARRTTKLINNFDHYASAFDRKPAFTRAGQREFHAATIMLRVDLGSALAAPLNDRFLKLLHQMVHAWGIGVRSSTLVDVQVFSAALRDRREEIVALDGVDIEEREIEVIAIGKQLWNLISSLESSRTPPSWSPQAKYFITCCRILLYQ
jgi:hypothetical protein